MRRLSLIVLLMSALTCRPAPVPAGTSDDPPEVRKLLQGRVDVLRELVKQQQEFLKMGTGYAYMVAEVEIELARAELDLGGSPARRRDLLARIVRLHADIDDYFRQRFDEGTVDKAAFLRARLARLTAEVELRRAGGTPSKDTKPARQPRAEKGG